MSRPAVPVPATWRCPVCGGVDGTTRWAVNPAGTEAGVDPNAFRPSSERYGSSSGSVVACVTCGHGSLAGAIDADSVAQAYTDAEDPVSLREEAGQIETARRALIVIEGWTSPGPILDVGCWTGSLLVAARDRGWRPLGIEPSRWASSRAVERGIEVKNVEFGPATVDPDSCRVVTACDVLEHLVDPGSMVERAGAWLEPGGVLYLTVPDAGSRLARALGRRWWSVLPMHVQYFTRASMTRLLTDRGFRVVHVGSHAKAFTGRYYAERLGGYHPLLRAVAVRFVGAVGLADRLIAPDFRDRMEVVAIAP